MLATDNSDGQYREGVANIVEGSTFSPTKACAMADARGVNVLSVSDVTVIRLRRAHLIEAFGSIEELCRRGIWSDL